MIGPGLIDGPLLTDLDPTPLILACAGLAWWVVWRLCRERARWRETRLTGEMLDRALGTGQTRKGDEECTH